MNLRGKLPFSKALYGILLLAVSAPAACGYILPGADISSWTARMEELAGGLSLFASREAILAGGGQLHAMDSNLWLWLPALVYRLCGNMARAYQLSLLVIQAGTLTGMYLLCRRLLQGRAAVYLGTLLYVTCPYRIYLCYDRADLWQATAWMLVPFYLYGIAGVMGWGEEGSRLRDGLWAALSLAGIGYASSILLAVTLGVTVLICLFGKKAWPLPAAGAGCLLCLPVVFRLAAYLTGGYGDLGMPLACISQRGYSLGRYFVTFAYKEDLPGLGLALMIGLAALTWTAFAGGGVDWRKGTGVLFLCGCVLWVFSLSLFPWDVLQRLGDWALRLIPLLYSPGLFFGGACLLLSPAAAMALERLQERTEEAVWGTAVLGTAAAGLGAALYLCNMLTYLRMPLEL